MFCNRNSRSGEHECRHCRKIDRTGSVAAGSDDVDDFTAIVYELDHPGTHRFGRTDDLFDALAAHSERD